MTPIPLRDAPARAGDRCWFVAASGRIIRPFTLLRLDRVPWPWDETVVVAEGEGLYSPDNCFVSLDAAEAFAARILHRELEDAERTVRELEGVRLTAAERVEVESCGR